ncbi:SgrR family transcriptional regulator [Halorubellus salinus]|uniref:SgrR family transcriptional regulator n=1 Tax=Halorubellus salinus TaxID=755309 RepID=UPI001D06CDB9|nr:SgrR family transcriptional regulator [Halorubellus salinus]
MPKHTTRDQLWTIALKRTHRDHGLISSDELAEIVGCSERTARDVLKTMVENDLLFLEKKGRSTRYKRNPHMEDPEYVRLEI